MCRTADKTGSTGQVFVSKGASTSSFALSIGGDAGREAGKTVAKTGSRADDIHSQKRVTGQTMGAADGVIFPL